MANWSIGGDISSSTRKHCLGITTAAGVAVLAHCNFSYRFFLKFGLMTTVCRERLQYDLHIEIGIGARKLARHFYRFVLVRHGCPLSDFDVGVML